MTPASVIPTDARQGAPSPGWWAKWGTRLTGRRTTRVLPQLGQRDSVALLAATTLEPDDDIATSIGRPPFSRDS